MAAARGRQRPRSTSAAAPVRTNAAPPNRTRTTAPAVHPDSRSDLAIGPDEPKAAAEVRAITVPTRPVLRSLVRTARGDLEASLEPLPIAVGTLASPHPRIKSGSHDQTNDTIMTVPWVATGVKMQFTHDTEVALLLATALVNTNRAGVEELADEAALADFLDGQEVTGARAGTVEELDEVRALRPRLAAVWEAAEEADVVAILNRLLAEARALPRLTKHDGWDWHLHLTTPDAPLVDRLGTEAAMGIADLVRARDLGRLKRCAGDDCDAVLVDLSRNRSRRYCDTGNCGNRAHVAAYRARKAEGMRDDS